jgi:exodeoxyribonuclease III
LAAKARLSRTSTQSASLFASLADSEGNVGRTYHVSGVPKLVLIGKDGRVQRTATGLDRRERLARDVVSLQELKAEQGAFPVDALRTFGYEAVWQGEPSWNGVAILARNHAPVLTRASLPGNPEDHQARYIEAAVQGVLITSIYLPNGNPQPGPKFNYKLAWFERLIGHAAELMASGAPVVLAGDYNVVPTPQDIYPTRSLDNNALIQPESRTAFARLLAQGWTDAMRKLHPDGPLWTFWDYKFERWPKNKGMRLDHFLLSPTLSDRLVDGGVDRWARSQVNASDHAPAWILLDL